MTGAQSGTPATSPAPSNASAKVALSFGEIAARLKGLTLPEVDVVYGIATGGVVPASLVAYRLGKPLELIDINFRREDNSPQRPAPTLLTPPREPKPGTRVLLVDDVAVTGQTMLLAKETVLAGCEVTTLALKGRADIVVFPEVGTCVAWPWKVPGQ
ncbi:MAG TPA: phosphoribosyltransferase [Trueperaceae bacterium]|nr:phosphoribosyltransferase [Trueperaceae bacterium]